MDGLSRAETDISRALRRLENAFKQMNDVSLDNGDGCIPNPVKMVRRLTALELALRQLQRDCQSIHQKRTTIVQAVIAQHHQNVENVETLLQQTAIGPNNTKDSNSNKSHHTNNLSGAQRSYDDNDQQWKDLSEDLREQVELFASETK